jgi:hypothetical protein
VWADEWVGRSLTCEPADRPRVERGMRRLYELAGQPWPGRVIWVDSPLAVAYSGPTTTTLLDGQPYPERHETQDALANQLDLVREAHPEAVPAQACFAVGRMALDRSAARRGPNEVSWTVLSAVGSETETGVHRQIGDAVGRAIRAGQGALDDALRDTVRGVVYRATGAHWAKPPARAHQDWLGWLHRSFHCRLGCPHCDEAYASAAATAVGSSSARDDPHASARWALEWASSLEFPLFDARKAPFMGGRGPALACQACLWFHRDHHGMAPKHAVRLKAFVDADAAGWWWPDPRFVVVSERPESLHHELGGPSHRRTRQLHRAGGPAVTYRDGWRLWYWHGFQVPQWAVEAPTVERIAAEPNVEVRRCAIEAMGWERFAVEARLRRVAAAPDPSNPRHFVVLYDVPERLWGGRVRLVLVTNGSTDRRGTLRRYGLTVPAHLEDPVEAVAWTYNLPRDVYEQIERRT